MFAHNYLFAAFLGFGENTILHNVGNFCLSGSIGRSPAGIPV
jgi:hypothetical protein